MVCSRGAAAPCDSGRPHRRRRQRDEATTMLTTRITTLLGIEQPVVLGGMGTGTSAALVAAVSAAGGLGILGATHLPPAQLASEVEAIRAHTDRPFGLNYLLAFV